MNRTLRKVLKKYDKKIQFSFRLLVFALALNFIMWTNPELPAAKDATAKIVAGLTGSQVIDRFYVKHDSFALLIVTDCVGWKELFIFFSLLIAWPLEKKWARAAVGTLIILVYNVIRLSLLVLFNGSFDYFHPAFQIISILVILSVWIWSVEKKPKKKPKKTRKKKKK